jgi:hypothetical protein
LNQNTLGHKYIIREKPWFDYGIQKRFSTQKEAHGVKKVFGLKI